MRPGPFGTAGNSQELFQRALSLHQRGLLAEAAALYDRILAGQADHFDALHLSGVIALQTQDTARGVALIETAIALNPEVAAAYANLGQGLATLGRFEAAVARYDRAIALQPGYVEAHINRGNALRTLGRYEEALRSYETVLALKPDYAEAHNNRGTALRDLGRVEDALACYERAIALKPDFAEARANRARVLRAPPRPAVAAVPAPQAPPVPVGPGISGALQERFERALELHQRGSLAEAMALYEGDPGAAAGPFRRPPPFGRDRAGRPSKSGAASR